MAKDLKVRGITIRFSADLSELIKGFQNIRSAATATTKKLNDVNKLLKLDPSNTTLLNQKWKYLGDAVKQTRDKIKLAKETLERLKKQPVQNVTDQMEALERQIIEDEAQLKKLEKQFNTFSVVGQKIENAGRKMQDFGSKIRSIGISINTNISMPLYRAMYRMVDMAKEAETSFTKVYTIAEEMAEDNALAYDRLKYVVRDASDETGVAITDFNEALYQTISASVDTADAVDYTTNAIKLARGGFTTTEKAVDIMTTIMNAYGMETSRTTEVMDRLIATQNFGKTTVDALALSLGRTIPSAQQAGVNLDNVATGMAVLTKNGIQTRIAATALRAFYDEINKTGSTSDKALRAMTGMNFKQLIESGRSVTEILSLLSQSAEEAGGSLSDMFGNVRSRMAVASIMADQGKEYNRILGRMVDSSGAAQRAFEKMNATPAIRMQIAMNKLKNTAIEMGADFLPLVTDIVDKIGELAKIYQKLSPKQKKFIQYMIMTGIAIGPVLQGTGNLIIGMGHLTEGFGKLIGQAKQIPGTLGKVGSGLKSLLGPISSVGAALGPGLALVGVSAAIGGILALIVNETGVLEGLSSKTADLRDNEDKLASSLKDVHNAASDFNTTLADNVGVAESSAQVADDLTSRLIELSNKESKTIDDTKEMKAIVGQLNYMFPELGLSINTTTSELSMTTNELKSFVDAANESAKAAAFSNVLEDCYEDIYKAQKGVVEAENEYNKIVTDKEAAKRELSALEEAHKDVAKTAEELTKAVNDGTLAYEDYDAKMEQLNSGYVEINGELVDYASKQQELVTLISEYSEAEEEANGKIGDAKNVVKGLENELAGLEETYKGAGDAASGANKEFYGTLTQENIQRVNEATNALADVRKEFEAGKATAEEVAAAERALIEAYGADANTAIMTWESMTDEQRTYVQAFVENVTNLQGELQKGVQNSMQLFEEFNGGTEITFQNILDNLDSQIKGVQTWEENMNRLMQAGVNEDLIQTLMAAGPSSAEAVQAIVDAISQGGDAGEQALDDLNSRWSVKISTMDMGNDAGQTLMNNVATSIGEADPEIKSLFNESGASTWTEFTNGMQESMASLSETMTEYGSDIVQGVAEGISTDDAATNAVEDMADDVEDEFTSDLGIHSPSTVMAKKGEGIPQGVAQGIRRGIPNVTAAISSLASAINLAGRLSGQIAQAQQIGAMIGAGLAQGMNSQRAAVSAAATAMAAEAERAARAKLAINSPSKVFEEIGLGTAEGFNKGVVEGFNAIRDVTSNAVNAMVPTIPQTSGSTNNINVTVNAAEGQNPREIAEYTIDVMMRKMRTNGAVWA